ncbi:hypothetical protein HYH03_008143 [Edaphochlamys debaryana]|uniref:Uncharacterized protein n=1 Tax=Edaphochlamys debaryana TaxID=47281 RepID=A0A835Y3U7_9CHLO|nr:hypothetical protein HYH03_008143 [Edaphochlamys debaryana]|eukprot:KAG2493626.1 hypothetical protein HYH03_008143 [Edaphochlamys debaryana]
MGNCMGQPYGDTPLLAALAAGNEVTAVAAVRAKPSVFAQRQGPQRRTMAHVCADAGQLGALVKCCELIWRTQPDSSGQTHEPPPPPPCRHPLILEACNAFDGVGLTPLMLACKQGHPEVVRYLLDQGADPWLGEAGPAARSALHHAAQGNQAGCVEALLGCPHVAKTGRVRGGEGRLVDFPSATGRTPLHVAAARGWMEVAAALCSHGASPTCRTWGGDADTWLHVPTGSTPLHVAAASQNLDMCVLLLAHWGANLRALDVTDPRVVADGERRTPQELPALAANARLRALLDPATPIQEVLAAAKGVQAPSMRPDSAPAPQLHKSATFGEYRRGSEGSSHSNSVDFIPATSPDDAGDTPEDAPIPLLDSASNAGSGSGSHPAAATAAVLVPGASARVVVADPAPPLRAGFLSDLPPLPGKAPRTSNPQGGAKWPPALEPLSKGAAPDVERMGFAPPRMASGKQLLGSQSMQRGPDDPEGSVQPSLPGGGLPSILRGGPSSKQVVPSHLPPLLPPNRRLGPGGAGAPLPPLGPATPSPQPPTPTPVFLKSSSMARQPTNPIPATPPLAPEHAAGVLLYAAERTSLGMGAQRVLRASHPGEVGGPSTPPPWPVPEDEEALFGGEAGAGPGDVQPMAPPGALVDMEEEGLPGAAARGGGLAARRPARASESHANLDPPESGDVWPPRPSVRQSSPGAAAAAATAVVGGLPSLSAGGAAPSPSTNNAQGRGTGLGHSLASLFRRGPSVRSLQVGSDATKGLPSAPGHAGAAGGAGVAPGALAASPSMGRSAWNAPPAPSTPEER